MFLKANKIVSEFTEYLIKINEVEQADSIIQQYTDRAAPTIEMYKLSAKIKLMLQQWSEAEQISKKLQQMNADQDVVDGIYALAQTGMGNYDNAINTLSKIVDNKPNDFGVLSSLIQAYIKAQKFDDASDRLQQFIDQNPDDRLNGLLMLAKVKYLQGKTNQAEAFLNDAISEYPKNIRAYRTLYKYYFVQKQSDKAKYILTRGLQAAPSSIELKMLLAEAYQAEGQNDKAIQLFQEVVEDQPNFDVARNNLAVLLTIM